MTSYVALISAEPFDRERHTRHTESAGVVGELVETELMPWPAVLVLESSGSDAMLFRYDALGNFSGDTWHESVDDGKGQASWEYQDLLSDWHEVPTGRPALEFGLGLVDWSNRADLLPALWAQHREHLSFMLSAFEDRISAEDRAQVSAWIEVNEFGLAFSHVVGALAEHECSITPRESAQLDWLAVHLDEDGRWRDWRERLPDHE
jgi:hypothetical protein